MSIVDDINAISDRVLALEQENDLLRQQLASGNTEAYDKLIDLLAHDIEWQEKHLTGAIKRQDEGDHSRLQGGKTEVREEF